MDEGIHAVVLLPEDPRVVRVGGEALFVLWIVGDVFVCRCYRKDTPIVCVVVPFWSMGCVATKTMPTTTTPSPNFNQQNSP